MLIKRQTLRKTDYGLDAPGVILIFLSLGSLGFPLGGLFYWWLADKLAWAAYSFLALGFLVSLVGMGTVFLMVRSSRVGKLGEYRQIVESLDLHGHERVLDVGCGRGFLLTAMARRLTTGKAVGVDIWLKRDQAGNHPIVTLANARLEGVLDRVEIKRNDIRRLHFDGDYFDAVVSALVLHNLATANERCQALREIVRVLKPGGRLALLDFQYTSEYLEVLHEAGFEDLERSGLRFTMYPPVRIITGRKPGGESTDYSGGGFAKFTPPDSDY